MALAFVQGVSSNGSAGAGSSQGPAVAVSTSDGGGSISSMSCMRFRERGPATRRLPAAGRVPASGVRRRRIEW